MLQRSSARYLLGLYLADLLWTVLSLWLARWLRVTLPIGKELTSEGIALPWPIFALVGVIWTVTFASLRAYDPQRMVRLIDEWQTVAVAAGVATLVLAGALYFSYRGLSRLLYVYFFALDIALCALGRWLMRRSRGGDNAARRKVLIVGAGETAQRVARALQPCAWMGIDILGYLSDDPAAVGRESDSAPVLGDISQTAELVRAHGVQEVILALPQEREAELTKLVAALQELPVNLKVVPDYSKLVFFRATLEQLGDVFLIGLKEPVIGPIDRLIKRTLDIVVALLVLVALAPLMALIALLVAVTSPGPVFYRSLRLGEGAKVFGMLKFRTMYRDADSHEQELVSVGEDGLLFFAKRQDDPRVTPLGRFLRRYSLDELPQLINVLRGEMSLVGPRPELPALADHYQSWQRKRFSVPQGMTGWWQISGRGAKPKYLHAEDDLYYIQNYSLMLDLRILWRTIGVVIRGEGAY